MLNSKQRAYLKSQASKLDSIISVGKDGFSPEVCQSISEAIEKRELIKISVLNNCEEDVKDVAEKAASRTHSEVVLVIGKKFVLFKKAAKNSKFEKI